jgi:hypothetical protein
MRGKEVTKLVERVKKKNAIVFKMLGEYDKSKFSDVKWKSSKKFGKTV